MKDLFHDLIISVFDEDKSSADDFLGRICIPIANIQNNHNIEYQLKTMDCEKFHQGKIGIGYSLCISHSDPAQRCLKEMCIIKV